MSRGSGGTDVGKTAAGVALGIFSVPVIIAIVVGVLLLGCCVFCLVVTVIMNITYTGNIM